jgi:hypothetical protein
VRRIPRTEVASPRFATPAEPPIDVDTQEPEIVRDDEMSLHPGGKDIVNFQLGTAVAPGQRRAHVDDQCSPVLVEPEVGSAPPARIRQDSRRPGLQIGIAGEQHLCRDPPSGGEICIEPSR